MRTPYCHQTNNKFYDDYYLRQVGRGGHYYAGVKRQKGHGLGNIFKGVVRSAMPVIKEGAKQVGKKALKAGIQMLSDAYLSRPVPKKKKKTPRRSTKKSPRLMLAVRPHPPSRKKKVTTRKRVTSKKTQRKKDALDF